MFEVARSCNPSQPLTTGVWHQPWEATPAELTALELSDVISFHCYGSYHSNIRVISYLKEKFGRPILNTEWLNRIQHNNVQEVFPLFYLERIHCWHWGLVAGLSQTYEPWQSVWNCYEAEMNNLDVTKWQHDIFRANGKPYDPEEIKIFKYYSELADGKISQDCDFNEYHGYKI
jgi:hypothetical protein